MLLAVRYRIFIYLFSVIFFTAYWYTLNLLVWFAGLDFKIAIGLIFLGAAASNFVVIWFLPIYLPLREKKKSWGQNS
jgi:hypothetical protein